MYSKSFKKRKITPKWDFTYVTYGSWLESTEPRDIGSYLNLNFEKFGFVFTARLRSYGLVLQLSF